MTSFAHVSTGRNATITIGFTANIARYGARFLTWYERARQRRHLKHLDPRMLDDIGVTHAQAEAEARKPGWVD